MPPSASLDVPTGLGPVVGHAIRPVPRTQLRHGEVGIGSSLAELAGLRTGDLVRLSSAHGGLVVAKVRVIAPGHGAGVALPATAWPALAVRLGDELGVQPVAAAPNEFVEVTVERDVADGDVQRITRWLRQHCLPVWSGAVLPSQLVGVPGAGRLALHEVRPDPSVVSADSDIAVVRWVEHDHEEGHHTHPGHGDGGPGLGGASFADVGALSEVRRKLVAFLIPVFRGAELYAALGLTPPRGILLEGPPGNGKTLLARSVAGELGARAILVSAPEIVGTFSGDTERNLRALFAQAVRSAPALIVMDEIDVLCGDRRRLGSMTDVRIASQLLSLMDGLAPNAGVVVVATTNRIGALDEAFRRPGRFDREVHVGPPRTPEEKLQILEVHTRAMPLTEEACVALRESAAHHLPGASGADLMSFARDIGYAAVARMLEAVPRGLAEDALEVAAEDVSTAREAFAPSLLRATPRPLPPGLTWGDIVGLERQKSELLQKCRDALEGSGRADGVLLYGPSGNGKSALVMALASELESSVVEIDGALVFSQWLGESEGYLRHAVARAREIRPCLVVLDHVELLGGRPEQMHSSSKAEYRVTAALADELDLTLHLGGVAVVGLTTRPEYLDGSITRPGRLGSAIEIPRPDRRRASALVAQYLRTSRPDRPDFSDAEVEIVTSLVYDGAAEHFSVAALLRALADLEHDDVRTELAGRRDA